jgi:hypothetical protein
MAVGEWELYLRLNNCRAHYYSCCCALMVHPGELLSFDFIHKFFFYSPCQSLLIAYNFTSRKVKKELF